MTWHFEVTRCDDPLIKMHFAAMNQEDIDCCLQWLHQMELSVTAGKPHPPDRLLLAGLPRGSIREAATVEINGHVYIAFAVKGRTRRLVDLATFCCMRLMALPGRDCEWWFDRSTLKNLPEDRQRLYLRFTRRHGIWALRIFADARLGTVIRQKSITASSDHWGHKDLRLINMYRTTREQEVARGKALREPFKGRELAIEACLQNFGEGPSGISLSAKEYEGALRRAFALLDRLHAHQIEDRTQS
ncbi:hypothetical protein ACNJYA_04785 [Bradyrhizobium sp. DASA03068]|uniref:hypothetical protein n=1 Tax=Bradyrhizobium sp. BLXBL-01 TaxID=3395915 RepID=UPI003F6FC253